MGIGEVLVILFVVFLLIGPKRMIELVKSLGEQVRNLSREVSNG